MASPRWVPTLLVGLACSAPLLAASPPAATVRPEDPLLDAVVRTLVEYRELGEPMRRPALERIAALGVRVLPTLYGLRCGTVHPPPEKGPLLDGPGRELLVEAMRLWPTERVAQRLLVEFDVEAPIGVQLSAIQLMGEVGNVRGLGLLLEELSTASRGWQRVPELQRRIEAGLVTAMARESGSFHDLRNSIAEIDVALLIPVSRALACDGRETAVNLLVEMLDRDPELDLAVLAALGELDPRQAALADGTRAHAVRPYLASSVPRARARAAVALGELHDEYSFGPLVALLDDPEPAVRRAALRALRELSGLRWPPDAERWKRWYRSEVLWLDQLAQVMARRSRAAEPAEAIAAMRQLSSHPLFRAELSPELVGCLRHPETAVAVGAAHALRRLGDPASIPALITALDDPRSAVANVVHQGLSALSGEDLPPDPEAWHRWLHGPQ